jgi:hypothetical protein
MRLSGLNFQRLFSGGGRQTRKEIKCKKTPNRERHGVMDANVFGKKDEQSDPRHV